MIKKIENILKQFEKNMQYLKFVCKITYKILYTLESMNFKFRNIQIRMYM